MAAPAKQDSIIVPINTICFDSWIFCKGGKQSANGCQNYFFSIVFCFSIEIQINNYYTKMPLEDTSRLV